MDVASAAQGSRDTGIRKKTFYFLWFHVCRLFLNINRKSQPVEWSGVPSAPCCPRGLRLTPAVASNVLYKACCRLCERHTRSVNRQSPTIIGCNHGMLKRKKIIITYPYSYLSKYKHFVRVKQQTRNYQRGTAESQNLMLARALLDACGKAQRAESHTRHTDLGHRIRRGNSFLKVSTVCALFILCTCTTIMILRSST